MHRVGKFMLNTIGYQGASPSDFIATLKSAGVQIVVDVRERAQSRRPGFSKRALADLLQAAGIDYQHLPELGDPKEGRDAARAGDFPTFRRVFEQVLASPTAKAAILQIGEIATARSACLMCYERDPAECHRRLVADQIDAIVGGKTRHLGVRKFEQAA